jgi:hypothetical protein
MCACVCVCVCVCYTGLFGCGKEDKARQRKEAPTRQAAAHSDTSALERETTTRPPPARRAVVGFGLDSDPARVRAVVRVVVVRPAGTQGLSRLFLDRGRVAKFTGLDFAAVSES